MSTEQLMEILKVRRACDTNPTSQSLLYELSIALERLKKYEDADAAKLQKIISAYVTVPHSFEQQEVYMRDINRIAGYMEQLKEQWERVPDWRFGQFIANVLGPAMIKANCSNLFMIEDEELFKAIQEIMDSICN